MNPNAWICPMLDAASERLLTLEESGRHATELRVSSDLYAALTRLRKRELDEHLPLLVLGTLTVEDPELAPGGFTVRE
jgi:hypothetical protein